MNSLWSNVTFRYVITGNSSSVSATYLSNSGEVHGGNSGGSTWISTEINSLPWDYDFSVRLSDLCQSATLQVTNNDANYSINIAIYRNGKLTESRDVPAGGSGTVDDDFCQ